mgnify:CR=1 FL=1
MGSLKRISGFYGTVQHPENAQPFVDLRTESAGNGVKSYDYWKKEHRSPKAGVHGYTYMVSTEYEKDGERRTGYTISKALTSAR